MIGWLLDFIFSNIWILFILFWVFRSFAKRVKQGMDEGPTTRMPSPVDFPWEKEQGPIVVKRYPPIEPPREKREGLKDEEVKSVPSPSPKEPLASPALTKKETKKNKKGPSPAVQGMIWSQVYGPPRAKAPHPFKRRT